VPGGRTLLLERLVVLVEDDDPSEIRTRGPHRCSAADDDVDTCGSNKFGCETFAAGYWEPGPACMGEEEIVVLDDPWPLPERICMDPVEGEPEGQSGGDR